MNKKTKIYLIASLLTLLMLISFIYFSATSILA